MPQSSDSTRIASATMRRGAIATRRKCALALSAAFALTLLAAGCGGSSSSTSSTGHSPTPTTSAPATAAGSSTPTAPRTQSSTAGASTGRTATAGATATGATLVDGRVSASADGLTASMRPATSRPKVERPWPISFTITRAGRPVHAGVSYEYLLGEQVVAHRSHYSFTGHFADVFKWPASAVGYPLTFRAVIVSGGVTIDLDYPIDVVR